MLAVRAFMDVMQLSSRSISPLVRISGSFEACLGWGILAPTFPMLSIATAPLAVFLLRRNHEDSASGRRRSRLRLMQAPTIPSATARGRCRERGLVQGALLRDGQG